jgi:hypothetical protein
MTPFPQIPIPPPEHHSLSPATLLGELEECMAKKRNIATSSLDDGEVAAEESDNDH